MKKIFYMLLVLLSFVCINVNALTEESIFKSDTNVNIEDEIDGNTFVVGEEVKLNAFIHGIGFALGEDIKVLNQADYVFLLGTEVDIEGIITNDAFVLGSEVTVEGIVNRDLYVVSNKLEIKGTVTRDIYTTASEIEIDDEAVVTGVIHLSSDAVLDSDIDVEKKVYDSIGLSDELTFKDKVVDFIYDLFTLLVVFVVMLFIVPSLFMKISKSYKDGEVSLYFKNILKGLMFILIIPIIFLMLLLSNIGGNLGIILMLVYIVFIMVSNAISSYILGSLVSKKIVKSDNNYITGIIGVIVVSILKLIPVVNIFTSLLGLGSLVSLMYSKKKIIK